MNILHIYIHAYRLYYFKALEMKKGKNKKIFINTASLDI